MSKGRGFVSQGPSSIPEEHGGNLLPSAELPDMHLCDALHYIL